MCTILKNTSHVRIVNQANASSTEADAEWSREPPDKCHQLRAGHASHVPTNHTFIYLLQLTQQQQWPYRHVSEVQCSSFTEVVNLEYASIFLDPTHWKILQQMLVCPARPRSNGYRKLKCSSYSIIIPVVHPAVPRKLTDRPTYVTWYLVLYSPTYFRSLFTAIICHLTYLC